MKYDTLGECLKIRREIQYMTQLNLSIATGIHPSQISFWENNLRAPTVSNLILLARGLDCSITELIGE